jgi:competence protein ComEA
MKQVRASVFVGLLVAGLLCAHASSAWAEDKLINLNTASAAELSGLKGIGDVKAKAIVDHREKNGPFKSVDDLASVPGIGDKLLETLRPQVTVGGPSTTSAAAAAPASSKH